MEIRQCQIGFKNWEKKRKKGPFYPKLFYVSTKERKGESKRAKDQVFLPLPQTQMVKLVVPFETRNEKLQAVRMQQDTIQIELEGTGKSTQRYFSSGKSPAENRGNFVSHYIKYKVHQSPWTLQWIQIHGSPQKTFPGNRFSSLMSCVVLHL